MSLLRNETGSSKSYLAQRRKDAEQGKAKTDCLDLIYDQTEKAFSAALRLE